MERPQKRQSAKAQKITTIELKAPADKPEGTWAIRGARILSMKGDEVIENGSVLVEGNRIVAVGPVDRVPIPDGTWTLDATGKP